MFDKGLLNCVANLGGPPFVVRITFGEMDRIEDCKLVSCFFSICFLHLLGRQASHRFVVSFVRLCGFKFGDMVARSVLML